MKDVILKRIRKAVRDRVFPGCSIGVVRGDGSRLVKPFGKFAYEKGTPKVLEDSIFDVASITKVIPTSSLALQLIQEGRLGADDLIQTHVPEFRNRYARETRVWHLLTHTVGYDGGFALSSYVERGPDKILDAVFTSELSLPPGEKFLYTNAASILLGLVVERISGKSLDALAREIFFEPLGMRRTSFSPLLQFSREEIVPTEEGRGGVLPPHQSSIGQSPRDGVIEDWYWGLQGVPHDESARVLQRTIVPGSAGLFSTVPDLLTFLEMLLHGGELEGERYFSKDAVRQMYTSQLDGIGESHGLGWELNQPRWMGEKCSPTTFGKTGFTGCSVLCDVERGVGVVILSNYTYPKRKKDAEFINAVRRDIHNVVFSL